MATSNLTRVSIALNGLILVAGLVLWSSRATLIEVFLESRAERKVSFFDSYAINAEDVVFLGDSITQGGLWPEIFPGIAVKNRGIGGDTTTGVLARLDQIISGQPRAVFLNIGTNDLTHGPEDRRTSYHQYRLIIERIQKNSPATSIYVQSLLPRAASYREDIEDFNSEIQEMANDLDVTFVNLYPHFLSSDGGIYVHLSNDELHLMGDGYQLWGQLLSPMIEPYREH
jgi:lysophospholipase L1-like esterase